LERKAGLGASGRRRTGLYSRRSPSPADLQSEKRVSALRVTIPRADTLAGVVGPAPPCGALLTGLKGWRMVSAALPVILLQNFACVGVYLSAFELVAENENIIVT
jgi:hypothetical protein